MLLKGYDSATAKTKANVDGEWGLGECWSADGWTGWAELAGVVGLAVHW